jgi:hypothetical protein
MDEEELDRAVAEYRSKKRCAGHCDRILPNTSEYFNTDLRRDRGNRRYIRSKCKDCARENKLEADQILQNECSKDPGYEMSFPEIAKHLGITTQGAINIYNRAIEKLKKRLKGMN